MKKLLRHFIINIFALYASSLIASGVIFEKGIQTVLLAGVGLTAVSLIVKPVINLLLLPLNLVTFGLFRWLTSTIGLYLVTLVVPGFKILSFTFSGFSSEWFDIPAFDWHGVMAFIAISFIISIIASFVQWLLK